MTGTNSVTIWIAVYAAVVASASFLWNVAISRRDVGRLSLTADLAVKGNGVTTFHHLTSLVESALDKEGYYLRVSVSNTGRRPVTLSYWATRGMGTKKPAQGFPTPPTLAESQSWEIKIDDLSDFRFASTSFFVTDTHGRNWPLPQEQLANLRDAMLRNRL